MRQWLRWQLPHLAFACAYFPATAAKRVLAGDPYGNLDPLERRVRDKWGWLGSNVQQNASHCPPIWIDMTSGGEVIQSRALLKQLGIENGGFVLSTNGYDSHHLLTRLYGSDKVFFSPWDVWWAATKALDALRPRAVVLVLSPYFPVLLRAARRRGIKTILVNGLIGPRARFANRSMERAIALGVHRELDAISVQTEEDAAAFESLGVPRGRIAVTGNLAADLAPLRMDSDERRRVRATLGLGSDDQVLIFGSTHAAERSLVHGVIDVVRRRLPRAKFIVAPRQLHEVSEFGDLFAASGLRVVRHTAVTCDCRYDVLMLDTFGELLTLYGAADAAYIGSSLVPLNARRGGHNPVEPLVHGTVPLFGPNMNLWRAATQRLIAAWPGVHVESAESLAHRAIEVLECRAPLDAVRAAGNELIDESTGAVERTVAFLRRELAVSG